MFKLDINLAKQNFTTSVQMREGLEEFLKNQKLNIPQGCFLPAIDFLKLAHSYFPKDSKEKVVNTEQICAYRLASDAVRSNPEYRRYRFMDEGFDKSLRKFLEKAIVLVESLSEQNSPESLNEEQIESYRKLYEFYEGLSKITEREFDEEQCQRVLGEIDTDEDLVNPRRGKYSYRL